MAKAIQVCGTASGVGKSIIVAALCRVFYRRGYRVAPFKAQNMALNSFVTADGKEIGRAQAEQAAACGISPACDMNPILLKPCGDRRSQVIVCGRPWANMSAAEYYRRKEGLFGKVTACYNRLAAKYDLVIIEGAGSPAEVNLKKWDIVNMRMAEYARAAVILVGDIDRGGVFASLVGTMELLDSREREMVRGFIINKFRGDKRLLKGGLNFLEKKTGKKVLGVVPYIRDVGIAEEDSLALENEGRRIKDAGQTTINIAVVKLPHISNFTDFDALAREAGVRLYYACRPQELDGADVIIIPGTKNTVADLRYLRQSGLAGQILSTIRCHPSSTILIGVCGGFQMLGDVLKDPRAIESRQGMVRGLGLFKMETVLDKDKKTYLVRARDLLYNSPGSLRGYEIHHGRSLCRGGKAAFRITRRGARSVAVSDGLADGDKRVWGTYIHGLFDNRAFRGRFLDYVLGVKGSFRHRLPGAQDNLDARFDGLAEIIEKNLDMDLCLR